MAFGRYDAAGFNNPKVIENPDILVLGSSHMEATNVLQTQNAAYLLGEKLSGRYSVYNLGISGHDFYKTCAYLEKNLDLYRSSVKAVIIETSTVDLTMENVSKVLSGTVERTQSHNGGLVGALQQVPFFRQVYHQATGGLLKLFLPSASSAEPQAEKAAQTPEPTVDQAAYDALFSYLAQVQETSGVPIVIVYHPTETFLPDGSVSYPKDACLLAFTESAERSGIPFVDLTGPFERLWRESRQVPHGFCTGLIGSGHLNAAGHAVMADAFYQTICDLEAGGRLCK